MIIIITCECRSRSQEWLHQSWFPKHLQMPLLVIQDPKKSLIWMAGAIKLATITSARVVCYLFQIAGCLGSQIDALQQHLGCWSNLWNNSSLKSFHSLRQHWEKGKYIKLVWTDSDNMVAWITWEIQLSSWLISADVQSALKEGAQLIQAASATNPSGRPPEYVNADLKDTNQCWAKLSRIQE